MNTLADDFREACSLGNNHAVELFLTKHPYLINEQHKINGWSGLHWAAKRGQTETVKLLISKGIDVSLVNNKGETAREVATGSARLVFGDSADLRQPTLEEFKPNYLSNPEVGKTWDSLRDIEGDLKIETVNEVNQVETMPIAHSRQDYIKITVFLSSRSTCIGCIPISSESTIAELKANIIDQLDDIPSEFRISRCSGELIVPISSRQYFHTISMHFDRGDVVILSGTVPG